MLAILPRFSPSVIPRMLTGRRGGSCRGLRRQPSSRAGMSPRRSGRSLAGDITRHVPFRYRHDGDLATIGKRAAAIDFGWIKLTGWIAWWMWGVAHIYFLIGLRNRLTVSLSWLWILRHRAAQRPADNARRRQRGRRGQGRELNSTKFAGKQSRQCHFVALDLLRFRRETSAWTPRSLRAPTRTKPCPTSPVPKGPFHCHAVRSSPAPPPPAHSSCCTRFRRMAQANQAHLRIMETTDLHVTRVRPMTIMPTSRTTRWAWPRTRFAHRARSAPRRRQRHPRSTMATSSRATRWATTWPMSSGLNDGDVHPVIAAMNTLGYDSRDARQPRVQLISLPSAKPKLPCIRWNFAARRSSASSGWSETVSPGSPIAALSIGLGWDTASSPISRWTTLPPTLCGWPECAWREKY